MPKLLKTSSTKKIKNNDRQANGLHIKDIVELQLKPCQSDTLYSLTQVVLGKKTGHFITN